MRPSTRIVLAVVAALAVTTACGRSLPAPAAPRTEGLPNGWQHWPGCGSTLALLATEDGVYAGGLDGLFRIGADGRAAHVPLPGTTGTVMVAALLETHAPRRLWVGHDQGLSIREGEAWHRVREADGLPHRGVVALTVAGSDSVWLGTPRGVVRLPLQGPWDARHMRRLGVNQGLPADPVMAIAEDFQGSLWFGTYAAPRGGVGCLADGRWRTWSRENGLPHPNVTSLLATSRGEVWAGCGFDSEGGVAVFARREGAWHLTRPQSAPPLTTDKVRSLFEDRDGAVWIGTVSRGLTIVGPSRTIRNVTTADGLPAAEVMAIRQGLDGGMWLGTPAGVVRVSSEGVRRLLGDGSEDGIR